MKSPYGASGALPGYDSVGACRALFAVCRDAETLQGGGREEFCHRWRDRCPRFQRVMARLREIYRAKQSTGIRLHERADWRCRSRHAAR